MIKICPEGFVSVHGNRFHNECIPYTEYKHQYINDKSASVGIGIILVFIVVFIVAFAIFYLVIKPFED